jgi:hypothetical protein
LTFQSLCECLKYETRLAKTSFKIAAKTVFVARLIKHNNGSKIGWVVVEMF